MPSLRRSLSSPSVRSSPYPSSTPSSIRTRPSAPHPRRSPGSATADRRVLADIEWWRVYDGQCDLDLQDQFQDVLDADLPPSGTVSLSAGGGSLEPPQTPPSLHSFSMDSMQYPLHSNPFAALSIAPQESNRYGRDSSVESTPEIPTAPLETIQLGLADSPLGNHFPFPSLSRRHPLFGLRSVSAPVSHREPDFADMGGDSFSLDQNLFQ